MSATVTPYEDGPLLLRGDFEIVTPDGDRIEQEGATVALCRCGKSRRKPFCDGTHKLVGFTAPADREKPLS
ncbi:CDGSH iron-sulfur domain-containing protein [Hamadaea tsunoensis]|uniref:CDGSH iron-sulfur domain-containing protein n=1 Tax=Hamadaea tsunoensis TaxID=53368 RepID=UPI00041CD689|nr:CDGSH iron-sulfur domain-containing protein [Hamadaea tsunoensis]